MIDGRSDVPQEEQRRRAMDSPVPLRDTERVACLLTPPELASRGQEIALLMGEVEQIQDALNTEKAAAKKAFEERQGKIRQLAKEIRERAVYREIDIEEREDEATLVIQVIRLDTGELIRERPMTEEERQRSLFRTANRPLAPPRAEAPEE